MKPRSMSDWTVNISLLWTWLLRTQALATLSTNSRCGEWRFREPSPYYSASRTASPQPRSALCRGRDDRVVSSPHKLRNDVLDVQHRPANPPCRIHINGVPLRSYIFPASISGYRASL